MNPNPFLKKLGLSDTDRVVIFHADDIGMCQATLSAYTDLVDFGLMSAASVMVPCPWFPATAAFCRDNQANLDMGVHLTLTSEWANYRWGPISTRDPASGLIDETGYFYAASADVQARAEMTAVQLELEAQLKRALAAGIDVTHIDSHMFAIFPAFVPIYFQLALAYQIPAFLFRYDQERLQDMGYEAETAASFARAIQAGEDQGIPLLDDYYQMSLDQHENRLEEAKQALDNLSAGITYFLIHPAQDTPELRAIAPDWRSRVADYQLFTGETFRAYVKDSGIHVIDYRTLRNLMRKGE